MAIRLLDNCCGVAEFRGTNEFRAVDVFRLYTLQRGNTSYASYSHKQHTFVVFSICEGYAKDFMEYAMKNKLGKVVGTESANNINHGGSWYPSDELGVAIRVFIFQPDHKRLTEWYKNKFDKTYILE